MTPQLVNKVKNNLDSLKASCPECISVVALKNYEPKFLYILTELFNICLKEFCVPDCWKVSLVVTVFKNVGEMSIAKTINNNMLLDHLEKCDLYSDFQYGFRSSWATADLVTVVSDRIASTCNTSRATQVVAFDISKALTKPWHSDLLYKLKACVFFFSQNSIP